MLMIVGSGYMGFEYAKAARLLDIPFFVVSRSAPVHARQWNSLGVEPLVAPVQCTDTSGVAAAVVAVDITESVAVSYRLIQMNIPEILVEKPLSLSSVEAAELLEYEESSSSHLHIGYNRRYFGSVQELSKIVESLRGPYHMHVDFSERIERLDLGAYDPRVLDSWVISNSSHVLDLLLYLAPTAELESTTTGGSLPWHTRASWFEGQGSFGEGKFSYAADWRKSGSWSVSVTHSDVQYDLSPLESLQRTQLSTGECEVLVKRKDPLSVKLGITEQLNDFWHGKRDLVDLRTQVTHLRIFEAIGGYGGQTTS